MKGGFGRRADQVSLRRNAFEVKELQLRQQQQQPAAARLAAAKQLAFARTLTPSSVLELAPEACSVSMTAELVLYLAAMCCRAGLCGCAPLLSAVTAVADGDCFGSIVCCHGVAAECVLGMLGQVFACGMPVPFISAMFSGRVPSSCQLAVGRGV